MGKLIDGIWKKGTIVTSNKKGSYDRLPRTFRETISKNHEIFKPEKNRYHLYVSYACPWAHRTLIYRKLKGLEDYISVSVVNPDMLENGWTFKTDFKGVTIDHIFNKNYLYEIYQEADSDITTSVTVPILWDKKNNTIVNNESSEIIRIFNTSFDHLTGNTKNFYPEKYQKQINQMNDLIYENINNGVYKCGFAKNQESYDAALENLFESLNQIESILKKSSYLVGEQLTEADLRLIPTLLRFDIVYFTHFKCNKKRILDFHNLSLYRKRIYELNAVKSTTFFDHIKRHYYFSHEMINPYRIVPTGPDDFI